MAVLGCLCLGVGLEFVQGEGKGGEKLRQEIVQLRQVEGVQGQDILPVLPDQVEIGPLVLGCLIRQLVIDRVKQVCGLLAGPGVAGAVDGLIQHLLGDQAGQGGGEGLVGEILLEPGAQPLLDGEGEEPAEDVPVFFLQGGQDLFLLGGQQVLQGGAGCLGLLRGDGAALGIQCFLGTPTP
mgnify:CR=1 FL=1